MQRDSFSGSFRTNTYVELESISDENPCELYSFHYAEI
jgi:hypothetical protein